MIGRVLLFLYQAAATLAVLLASPWILWRAARHPREMKERFGVEDPGRTRRHAPIWLHAASLGELEGVRALLAEPGWSFAGERSLTLLSVSVRERARDLEATGWRVRFAPLDLWFVLAAFLRREQPRGLILFETELWPATLFACRLRGVPVAVVSGRLSPRRWRRTRLARPWLRPGLEAVVACAAQSEADAARFRELGLPRVEVTGNLKYRLDRGEAPAPWDDGRFLFVAGSLRGGDTAHDPEWEEQLERVNDILFLRDEIEEAGHYHGWHHFEDQFGAPDLAALDDTLRILARSSNEFRAFLLGEYRQFRTTLEPDHDSWWWFLDTDD